MSKYQLSESSICIKDTDLPKNKLNILDSNIIHGIENNFLRQAYNKFLNELKSNTKFNEKYFINLHKKTFESLYDFAGIYRTENMTKKDSLFCLAINLSKQSKRIFDELSKDDYLKKCSNKKEFANKLAYFQGELIALHPFYELNGRTLRLFCDMLCLANGYKGIDYSNSIYNKEYIKASIECVQYADVARLENIIFNGLDELEI